MEKEKLKIFISYSHEDADLFNVLKKGIETHSKNSKNIVWDLWSDVAINAGELWHEVIQESVQNSHATILLVSHNFFASDYIKNEEFLKFIEKSKKENFTIFPVLLSDCDFSQWEELVKIQFFNPQGREYQVAEFKNKIIPYDYVEKPNLKNTYHKKCVEAFEKSILSVKKKSSDIISPDFPMSALPIVNIEIQNTTLENLSDERLLKLLNSFKTLAQKRNLSEEEKIDAIDTRNKLIYAIFNEFDNNQLKEEGVSFAIFDRIIKYSQIQKTDIDLVQQFRNNEIYSYQDRSLIVSGLTLSILNQFDANKIHLLIDFVTDFEEETWQRALVGLLFSLVRYNNRFSRDNNGHFEIIRRLDELKKIPNVQRSILEIDYILRKRCFSKKSCFHCPRYNKDKIIKILQLLVGNDITITKEDLSDFQDCMEKQDSLSVMYREILNPDKFKELLNEVENNVSAKINIHEWFEEYLNIESYLKLSELNPFALNLKDEIFTKPKNWFYPFKVDENNIKHLDVEYPIDIDLSISDFVTMIQNSNVLSDIEKIFIVSHIKEFTKDFLYYIIEKLYIETMFEEEESAIKKLYIKIIRDLYRFSQFSAQQQNNNSFDNTLKIYNKSLLEKIADEITQNKIDATHLYDDEKYDESLKILQNIHKSNYDLDIYSLFRRNYVALKNDEEAILYLDEAIKLNPNDDRNWRWKGSCLNNLKHYEDAIICFDEAIKLNPNNDRNWQWKGSCLNNLQHYEDAIICFDEAIKLNPNNDSNWQWKDLCLTNLRLFEENKK